MTLVAKYHALPVGEPLQDLLPPAPVTGGDSEGDFIAFDTEDTLKSQIISCRVLRRMY